ncbi:MAG: hypothetical protein KDB14_28285 [Planctomycetales bacterium]|nr:hypothetical protein [Planctomycetales bacterium]
MSEKQPVHEIRLGRVTCAIWENTTSQGIRHNVTFRRLYKAEEQWKSTDGFGRDDLHLVAKLAGLAETWIYEQGR